MTPETSIDPHAAADNNEESLIGRILCYVCETDITPKGNNHKSSSSSKDKDKEKSNKLKPGLVEIRSEGTGFAQGGDNIAKKQGVAFQC